MILKTERFSFLDGMRGWASLAVFFWHILVSFRSKSGQLLPEFTPPLSADGVLAVYVFFVLSGIALSINFIRGRDRKGLMSLALRRYPRLTIPIFFSCSLAYLLHRAGFFFNVKASVLGYSEDTLGNYYAFSPDLGRMLHFVFYDVYFNYWKSQSYNPVLWTMPLELLGSMVVFCVCAILGGFRRRAVMIAGLAVIMGWGGCPYLPFVLGIIIAIYYCSETRTRVESRLSVKWISFSLIMAAALFSGISLRNPDLLSRNPLSLTLAATAFVFGAVLHRSIRHFFETPLSKYLGSISFPLYLTHLLVICSYSSYLFLQLSRWGMSGWPGKAVLVITSLVLSIIAAHLFRRVETLSISVSRAFSDAVLKKARPSGGGDSGGAGTKL